MEIKITKSSRSCSLCERPFEHEEVIYSLVKVENCNLIREDYDQEHWEQTDSGNSIAAWSTAYIDPKVAEQQPPEVFSPLRRTFYEAAESEDRVEIAKAYLAAQLLRRQKVFRLVKEFEGEEGEVKMALFADRIGNRLIEVGDPDLSYAELDAGRHALLAHLHELESGEAEKDGEDPDKTEENTDGAAQ